MHAQVTIGDVIKSHYAFYQDEFKHLEPQEVQQMYDEFKKFVNVDQRESTVLFYNDLSSEERGSIFYNNRMFEYGWKVKDHGPRELFIMEMDEYQGVPLGEKLRVKSDEEKKILRGYNYSKLNPYYLNVVLWDSIGAECRKLMKEWSTDVINNLRKIKIGQTKELKEQYGEYFLLTVATIRNGKVTYRHYNSRLNTYDEPSCPIYILKDPYSYKKDRKDK